ncbi:MBL fold metallo-hydrolase [Streptomyces sulfonofaciens]|uniref:MBL fold metallo-hydrolase n=1 Tax=Streptomyces sulfonofaciens TaxID=68272 RepID=A0A919G5C3_9ACTN|nr:MBL fold metallo-hydrolase [Streptomyces sulfonofaciens]GHH77808.1 MBL fold metallo-hydrolase [Streptomyces sulfonofaciens]
MQQKNRPFELAHVQMRAVELGDGVHAVMATDVDETDHTATNAGFVVGSSGVLVIESLTNGRLASQVMGEVRKVTPLPIRFLVNTSYHGDHCFGNFAFPSQTVIIHHTATKRVIDERFEKDRAFMIDLLGTNAGIEEAVARSADITVSSSCSLDLGGKHVDIEHIGFCQTDGDLIVRMREDNILFVGNMLQAPPPAFPWLLDGRAEEALITYRRLYDIVDDDTLIVPGHGRTMRRADIIHSISYIEKLCGLARDVRSRELPTDQVNEALAMKEYSDYSMYEFIHFQVNIPAVLNTK